MEGPECHRIIEQRLRPHTASSRRSAPIHRRRYCRGSNLRDHALITRRDDCRPVGASHRLVVTCSICPGIPSPCRHRVIARCPSHVPRHETSGTVLIRRVGTEPAACVSPRGSQSWARDRDIAPSRRSPSTLWATCASLRICETCSRSGAEVCRRPRRGSPPELCVVQPIRSLFVGVHADRTRRADHRADAPRSNTLTGNRSLRFVALCSACAVHTAPCPRACQRRARRRDPARCCA